jgi:hypothetical protein
MLRGGHVGRRDSWRGSAVVVRLDNAQAVTYNPTKRVILSIVAAIQWLTAGEVLCTIAPCLALAAANQVSKCGEALSLKNSTLQPRSYMILSKFIIQLQAP